jgi:AraC-like DNA-binding protein
VRPELEQAWRLIVGIRRPPSIADVAQTIGWSRRHLLDCFVAEYGVTPKELHRIARFDRSKQALRTSAGASLAEVAAACGYFDQSHLAREWNQLAGCAPSRWLSSEELSFVQDGEAHAIAGLTA